MVPHPSTPGNDPLPQSVAAAVAPGSQAVAVEHGRARATAAPAIAGALRELLGEDVRAWIDHGFEVVKERTVRLVLRGAIAGVPVHAKVFRPDRFADRARDLLRGDRARREHDHLVRAHGLGLPTVIPLAHGLVRDGEAMRSFVLTRTVDGAPFEVASATAGQLARAGQLLRTVHDRGLAPQDLHAGNLLVARDGTLHLVDLTSVRHGGDPGQRERARALAFFCHEVDGGAVDPRMRPLLTAYLAAGPALPATFAVELAAATRRWRAGALPAFGRRAERDCRHTATTRRRRAEPRWFWHLLGPGADDAMRAACTTFATSPPAADKEGRRGAVWLQPEFVVKQRDAAAARRLWRASYWLQFARVPTPQPIAMRLHGGRGLVFVQHLAAPNLASELAAGSVPPAAFVGIARRLGDAVGRLHAHGLGNRDLKFENLVRDPRDGAIAMVDLDGVRRRPTLDTRGRGADLGRLQAAFVAAGTPGGATVRTAFLRAYLRAHRHLLTTTPIRRVLRAATQRAGEWAEAHRAVRAGR
jgi:tRNA A-37 threonylcarbamoyl transferase component Bud32